MNNPIVSVIIPCLNAEKFISRALRSILHQSLNREKYEIIVINDGSTDNSDYLIKQFKEDIRYFTNDKNMGLPNTLNRGILEAKGKYICRLDADDFVNQYYLLFLLEYLVQHPEAKVCKCDYYLVDENGENRIYTSSLENPIGCGTIFELDLLSKVGGYNKKYLCNEEKELFIRIERLTKVHHLPMPLYRYRKHPESLTTNDLVMTKYDQILEKDYPQN
ncbi:glycosyltransferase family 2 protein [Prochlorococcus marinus]|uniref:Glycosyltransferase 2-like domain-containing protein n=1 Tax=Prochlorococcus marinus (strain AS9601) TaxID=146891 RepID=A2BSE8_PROMS|nr:glycosyltransferase [Prochlorococcus marinus]ABM70709.1 Hypothetical protein A9601_14251 [Prochlorococcus marinus str. AS9601]